MDGAGEGAGVGPEPEHFEELSDGAMNGPSDSATIRSEFGEMRSLNSSHLSGCRYDPTARELTIEFQDGDVYTYRGVDQGVYEGLLSSGSPGNYFRRQIRGLYPHSMG